MDEIKPIALLDNDLDDPFKPNPDDYEEHTLIGDSIRGSVGDVVKVHKNDLAILRANKLIAAEGEEAPTEADKKAQAKAEKEAKAAQAKAEKEAKAAQVKAEKEAKAAQVKAEAAAPADLPAVPNIADLPGV